MAFKNPQVLIPQYIGMSLQVDGVSIKKPRPPRPPEPVKKPELKEEPTGAAVPEAGVGGGGEDAAAKTVPGGEEEAERRTCEEIQRLVRSKNLINNALTKDFDQRTTTKKRCIGPNKAGGGGGVNGVGDAPATCKKAREGASPPDDDDEPTEGCDPVTPDETMAGDDVYEPLPSPGSELANQRAACKLSTRMSPACELADRATPVPGREATNQTPTLLGGEPVKPMIMLREPMRTSQLISQTELAKIHIINKQIARNARCEYLGKLATAAAVAANDCKEKTHNLLDEPSSLVSTERSGTYIQSKLAKTLSKIRDNSYLNNVCIRCYRVLCMIDIVLF